MIPDFGKAMSALADADSRLEQIANQQKLTNGLLALLILTLPRSDQDTYVILSPVEHTTLIALVRTAFNDPTAHTQELHGS